MCLLVLTNSENEMTTDQSVTMAEWIFKPDSSADKLRHFGFGGFILAALATNAIKQLTPSSGITCIICLAFALLLALPVVLNTPPKDITLRWPTIAIAVAYLWMS